jgi:hypothetical protein
MSQIETLENRTLFHGAVGVAVNFAPMDVPRAPGMLPDYGSVFDYRRGGVRYGWNVDQAANAVDLNATKVQRNDTFIRMPTGTKWEMRVEDGPYTVYLVAGDLNKTGERMALSVEGQLAIAGATKARKPFLEGSITVEVNDGRLTIASAGEFGQDKINYVAIASVHGTTPNAMKIVTVKSNASESGPVSGEIRIERWRDISQPVTVPLIVTGTATNGVDYGRIGRSVTFAAGQSVITLPVHVVADLIDETNETVIVTLGKVPNYAFATGPATVTIANAG